ncbi:unnamed protein product [Camellia sinensis]
MSVSTELDPSAQIWNIKGCGNSTTNHSLKLVRTVVEVCEAALELCKKKNISSCLRFAASPLLTIDVFLIRNLGAWLRNLFIWN